MISVSNGYREYIRKPGRVFKCRVTCEELVLNEQEILSIGYEENLFNQEEFTLGTAIMSVTNVEVKEEQYIEDKITIGKELLIEIAINTGSIYEYVPLGYFIVKDVEKNNRKITFSCSDRMSKFSDQYVSDLVYPATLLQIADDICSKVGLTLTTRNFTNYNYIVAIKPDFSEINLRTSLSYVAELAGGFARINRLGNVDIFNVNPDVTNSEKHIQYTLGDIFISEDLILTDNVITKNNLINLNQKKYTISKLDKLVIDTGNVISEIGKGENAYYIVDNIFAQNPPELVKTIFQVINGISYIPFEIKWQGDLSFQCGDNLTISSNGSIINTFLTGRKLIFKGGLTEEYRAVGKSNVEKKSTTKGNVSIELKKVKTEIKVMAGEISQKVTGEGDFETLFKQNTEEFDFVIGKDGMNVKFTKDKVSIKNGGLSVENSNGTVVIDGSSNMFKIQTIFEIQLDAGDNLQYEYRVKHGLGYVPAYVGYQVASQSFVGISNTLLPAMSISTNDGNLLGFSTILRANADENDIILTLTRANTTYYNNPRVKVFVYKEALI